MDGKGFGSGELGRGETALGKSEFGEKNLVEESELEESGVSETRTVEESRAGKNGGIKNLGGDNMAEEKKSLEEQFKESFDVQMLSEKLVKHALEDLENMNPITNVLRHVEEVPADRSNIQSNIHSKTELMVNTWLDMWGDTLEAGKICQPILLGEQLIWHIKRGTSIKKSEESERPHKS